MKKLLAAIAIITAFWSAPAAAQCNGQFGASHFCGTGASSGAPGQQPYSAIFTTLPLANSGIFVGNASNIATAVSPTGAGDCTFTFTNLGVFGYTCLKTNGVAFGTLATQSSVLSSQLPSPFTNGTVQSNTGFFATYTNNTPIVNNHIALGDGSGGLKDGGGSAGTVTEQKNTAGAGLAISGNCDNTSTNASSPCQYAQSLTNAILQASPGNPTAFGGTTALMEGLGATCHLTPIYSTRIRVHFQFTVGASGTTPQWQLAFGTGTAPANAAAATGTTAGSKLAATSNTGGSVGETSAIITGLTAGTAYWFDLQVTPQTTSTPITNISCDAFEF